LGDENEIGNVIFDLKNNHERATELKRNELLTRTCTKYKNLRFLFSVEISFFLKEVMHG
jgi:hypothetical protein